MMATTNPCQEQDDPRCPSPKHTCAWCEPSPSPRR